MGRNLGYGALTTEMLQNPMGSSECEMVPQSCPNQENRASTLTSHWM